MITTGSRLYINKVAQANWYKLLHLYMYKLSEKFKRYWLQKGYNGMQVDQDVNLVFAC